MRTPDGLGSDAAASLDGLGMAPTELRRRSLPLSGR